MPSGKHLMRAFRLCGLNPRTAGLLARHIVHNCDDVISSDALAAYLVKVFLRRSSAVEQDTAANILGAIEAEWGSQSRELLDVAGGVESDDVPGQTYLPIPPATFHPSGDVGA